MVGNSVDSAQAIREQLEEQREALHEVEAALQHGDDAEMMQVSIGDHICHCNNSTGFWQSSVKGRPS